MSLTEFSVHGLGTVDEVVLEPGAGLTAVTGESGAGKSMLMLGLALLGGARADGSLLRAGSSRILIEARFAVRVGEPLLAGVLAAGAELDDGELLVSRTISAAGRSRCQVGGCSVPLGVLGELIGRLVQTTSQSSQLRLAAAGEQRASLDRYAGSAAAELTISYHHAYQRWRALRRELDALAGRSRASAFEADLLRGKVEEILRVDPQPGEDIALAEESSRLAGAAELGATAAAALAALAGDDRSDGEGSALSAVSAARRGLAGATDMVLAEARDRLSGVSAELGDIAAGLAQVVNDRMPDEQRLAEVGARRDRLRRLTRAHGLDVDGLLAWVGQAAQRLGEYDGADDRLQQLAKQEQSARAEAAALAARLTAVRTLAAAALSDQVTATLGQLAMPSARVEVRVSPLSGSEPGDAAPSRATATARAAAVPAQGVMLGPNGADEIAILLQAHPSGPLQPLGRGASGGELSRVLLALEVALSDAQEPSTLVFDEIDAGVGGRTAAEVGRLLAGLGQTRQVLCVTHLPQVAAHAEQHLLVHRDRSSTRATTQVRALADAERVTELSRMLAGIDDSPLARGHARELLDAAARPPG